jgi:hypothetical protein
MTLIKLRRVEERSVELTSEGAMYSDMGFGSLVTSYYYGLVGS